jgi:F-type H+-transporting ATPase subunit epsilon
MRLDIVTPERRLISAEVISVSLPGAEGDMTLMDGHAPVITTLRPGLITVTSYKGMETYAVTGGFAEIAGKTASVLAERAMPASEMNQAAFDALLAEADAARKSAQGGAADAAAKAFADIAALGAALGLAARPH